MNLIESSNGLVTIQTDNQTLVILLSTLLGSVFGMMGAASGVMRQVEGNKDIFKNRLLRFWRLKSLKNSRKKLKNYLDLDKDRTSTQNSPSSGHKLEISFNSILR